MDKQTFLGKLRGALRWTFTQDEINDIAADYAGFFEHGKNEGKSELQICTELGEPHTIADELKGELGRQFSPRFMLKSIALAEQGWRKHWWVFCAGHLFLAGVVVFFQWAMWQVIHWILNTAAYELNLYNFSQALPFVSRVMLANVQETAIAVSLCFGVLLGIYGALRLSRRYLSLVLHGIGAALVLFLKHRIFQDLSIQHAVPPALIRTMIVYGVVLLFTAVVALVIGRKASEKEAA